MISICLVLASEPDPSAPSGVEKATHALCAGLLRAGHDVTLITDGHGDDDAWPGVATIRVPQSRRRMLLGGANEWCEEVVHALSRLEPAVAQGQGLGFAGSAVVRWRGGARVVAAHGNPVRDLRHAYSLPGWALRAPLARASGRKVVRRADTVVNVTTDWRVNCPQEPRTTVHIPNPIDGAFFAVTWSPEPGTVVFFGGARRIKGADVLLKAWPRVLHERPDATLDLYGFDATRVTELPPNCACHEPLHGSEETAAAMRRASVVVIPSRFEVSPLVAAEAMAIGVPLVATDVGGLRAMTEGVASLCGVRPADIAHHLVAALEGGFDWASRLREGRRRSEAFRSEAVVTSYMALYEDLLHGRPASQAER
jgi:glycosyltransferase involved in cell wall biosynthesis